MSKRFGRNQKRAMQIELSETKQRLIQVENSRTYLGEALRDEQQKTRSFKAVAQLQDKYRYAIGVVTDALQVIKEVCPDSSALRGARQIHDDTWIVERHEMMSINLAPQGREPEFYDVRRLDLYQLEIELLAADPFRDSMEFQVGVVGRNRGQVVAGLRHTSQALIRMGADRIAKELAPHIHQALQERFS